MFVEPDGPTAVCADSKNGPPEFLTGQASLILTDPPYGTGKVQRSKSRGYKDGADTSKTVQTLKMWVSALCDSGAMVVICDYRMAADVIVGLRETPLEYMGEIVWEFGLGRPRTSWWPVRHNNCLTFSMPSAKFNSDAIPRHKRLAPKAGYGDDKPAGSVWFHTMSNTDPERVDYPNQKPLSLLYPFIEAHTNAGDLVVDPYCGSGSTLVAATGKGRRAWGCDVSQDAVSTTQARLNRLQLSNA